MSRLGEIVPEDLTARQRDTYDRIASGPRQAVRGPLAAWVRAPEFADRAEALGTYCRFHNGLPPRINELAVLMVARHWHATFAWIHHVALAIKAGLSEEVIDALRCGDEPLVADQAVQVAHDFVGELLRDKWVSDRAWRIAVAEFGEAGVIDLIGISGYYGMVAMTLIACGIGTEIPDPFFREARAER